MEPDFKLKATWHESWYIIYLPGDEVYATLDKPEMLYITDGDPKA